MAVSDGVPNMLLLSAAATPFGVRGVNLESKRDAEQYLKSTGLNWTIVRAPTLYTPGERRNPVYLLISVLGAIPLLGLPFSSHKPIAVDTAARGIAILALTTDAICNRLIAPRQFQRLGRAQERPLGPAAAVSLSNTENDIVDVQPL